MLSNLKQAVFFFVFFAIGFGFINSVSEKMTAQRDPATVNGKIFEITNLTSDQIKSQLQKKIKVTPTIDGKKTISFSGFSSALCKTYPTIEIEFSAEGVAVGGDIPLMKIKTPCAEAQDPSEIAAINLPIDKILKEKPRNAEFSYDGFNAVVSFVNSADEWPHQWVLKRVEFQNPSGKNKSADFNRSPASFNENSADRPIVLEF